jgi:hypothetical protein
MMENSSQQFRFIEGAWSCRLPAWNTSLFVVSGGGPSGTIISGGKKSTPRNAKPSQNKVSTWWNCIHGDAALHLGDMRWMDPNNGENL